jgi:chromate transporter
MKIGGLTFGGGLSMLPMLEHELVKKKEWIDSETLLDCYAIGQCTPGIIAVNTATFIGYKRKGVFGAIFSTMGMIFPSLVIITFIALFFEQFMEYEIVAHALMGIKAVVCALMFQTILGLVKKSVLGITSGIICVTGTLLAIFTDVSVLLIVLVSACVGILIKSLEERGKAKS